MNYKNSRDAVWQLLIKNKVTTLPVSVHRLCRSEKIRLFTFSEGARLIKKLGLESHTEENDAFSFARIIFYDDRSSPQRQRFSVAHELGHIVLHAPTFPTVFNREISSNDNPLESEANVFASRLLAPMCVIHFLGLNSPKEIAKTCDISDVAAQIRYERLCAIRERDHLMRREKGYGCFLLSSLEKQVFQNFSPYIEKYRKY